MSSVRLSPPWWQHDAYSLRRLAAALGRMMATHLPGTGGAVADLGAGEAPYRGLFEARGFRYLRCDLAETASDIVIEPGRPLPIADGTMAVVASFQVLEHVWDLDWYLGEALRILAPQGRLLLSTHGVWPYHPHPGDFRRWTRTGLVAELESRGFAVVDVEGVVGPLAWTTQFRTIGLCQVLQKLPGVGGLLSGLVGLCRYAQMWLEDRITPAPWIQNNAAIYVVVAERSREPT